MGAYLAVGGSFDELLARFLQKAMSRNCQLNGRKGETGGLAVPATTSNDNDEKLKWGVKNLVSKSEFEADKEETHKSDNSRTSDDTNVSSCRELVPFIHTRLALALLRFILTFGSMIARGRGNR